MRQIARVDRNQSEIVKAVRSVGASVLLLHRVGSGCPDLLVGRRGRNLLLEVKDGNRPPSEQKLTEDEQTFHATWPGHKAVVRNAKEAIHEVLQNS